MIDPNIWTSEDMSRLTIQQRLLVIGLFSNADDHGKGKSNPAYIRSMVFPYDDIPLSEIKSDMEAISSVINIEFYEVNSNSYYRFTGWDKWQTVQKPQDSLIPDPVENEYGMSQESFSTGSRLKERKGKEVRKEEKGKEDNTNPHSRIFLELINSLKIKCKGVYQLDQLTSYVGLMESDLVQEAIKRSERKSVAYILTILEGWNEKGYTKLSDLPDKPKPKNKEPTEEEKERWIRELEAEDESD
jgi:hypothetical protein